MEYTQKQYALMEKLSDGLIFDCLDTPEKEILSYLESAGIAAPNVQIADGYWHLSQEGMRILQQYQNEQAAKLEVLQRRLSDAQEKAKEKAEQKRQQRFENKIAVANLLIPFITFVLGIAAEHYVGVIGGIQWLVRWAQALFE